MVRIDGPLLSLTARGWLGRTNYHNWGFVYNPYPIGLLNRRTIYCLRGNPPIWQTYHITAFGPRPYPLFIAQYYSNLGWCYQMRRTWHGIGWAAIRPPIGPNPRTQFQQQGRVYFGYGMGFWQSMPYFVRGFYNYLKNPRWMSGMNRFLHYYLFKKPFPVLKTAVFRFDASKGGPFDPNNVWASDAYAFDDLDYTSAQTTTNGSPTANYLQGNGTNAVDQPGDVFSVRVRIYYYNFYWFITGIMGAAIYTQDLEYLGVCSVANAGWMPTWSAWQDLRRPKGGWTWEKVKNLVIKFYNIELGGTAKASYAQLEVYYC